MTAVAGVVANGRVYIGADAAASNGWSEHVRSDTKVFRNGPYLFGFTTSFRMGQLLHHALQPPAPPVSSADLDRFLVTEFIDSVRQCLKAGGWAETTSEREKAGEFLLGVAGRLLRVDSDYQVAEDACGYSAVGSGYLVALGSLHTTDSMGLGAKRRVELALEAAAAHTAGVRAPFTVRMLGRTRTAT